MNCYEWRHNVSLSAMSITANIAYNQPNPDPEQPPIPVTITGTQTYSDVGPPYSRKSMRCGFSYEKFHAVKQGLVGYTRFIINGEIAPKLREDYYPLDISIPDSPTVKAGIFDSAFDLYPQFPTGLFKPWISEDPAFVCADGVWRKSTAITKGSVRILTEESAIVAYGFYDRIESGAVVTYFLPDDYEFQNPIGTGTISYDIQ